MAKDWKYIPGDYHMICDVCGEKHRKSEMRQRWDNLWVDARCWNPRQPQDFVQARVDQIPVPVSRPHPADTYISTPFCTATGRSSVADYGVADCSICDLIVGI